MKNWKLWLILSAIFVFAACEQTATNNTTNNSAIKKDSNAIAKTEPTAKNEPTAPSDEIAAGRKHYSENCAGCHKENGSGGKVDVEGKTYNADDLRTEKMKKMGDEKYFKYIKDGIPDEGMPAFKDKLTDDQIKEVVKFIRKELQKN